MKYLKFNDWSRNNLFFRLFFMFDLFRKVTKSHVLGNETMRQGSSSYQNSKISITQ